MTLCVAWLRQVQDNEELIFATDSCLSAGERWHYGVKLFELPRKDCLICFAGETQRTYPLILNLISSIKFDENISNPHTDIKEVLDYLTTLFTNLCHEVKDYGTRTFEEALGEFVFLFGGWSWKNSQFYLWRIEYSHEVKAFLPKTDYDKIVFSFIGDNTGQAKKLLIDEITESDRLLSGRMDMEPLTVLLKTIRDASCDTVDGAIQIAKIYPPGVTEFFGVMWPNERGKKTFLGRDVSSDNNPMVRFIDPETANIVGEVLPETLSEIEEDDFGIHYEFVSGCYPSRRRRGDLSERDEKRLRIIFRDVAYTKYISDNMSEVDE
jgi:hypothetical protein